MEPMISLYIDNELSVVEKISFVEKINSDDSFKDDTISLLKQEVLLRGKVSDNVPRIVLPEEKKIFQIYRRIFFQWGIAAAAVLIIMVTALGHLVFQPETPVASYRFVLYQPDVSRVDIAGDFSQWHKLPLNKVGNSGYWEIHLNLSEGEHRFAYIVDEQKQIADPTVLNREQDDFGGENSIIKVEI